MTKFIDIALSNPVQLSYCLQFCLKDEIEIEKSTMSTKRDLEKAEGMTFDIHRFYIQSSNQGCVSVCVCVCLSVCLSVESRLAKLLGQFQQNLPKLVP